MRTQKTYKPYPWQHVTPILCVLGLVLGLIGLIGYHAFLALGALMIVLGLGLPLSIPPIDHSQPGSKRPSWTGLGTFSVFAVVGGLMLLPLTLVGPVAIGYLYVVLISAVLLIWMLIVQRRLYRPGRKLMFGAHVEGVLVTDSLFARNVEYREHSREYSETTYSKEHGHLTQQRTTTWLVPRATTRAPDAFAIRLGEQTITVRGAGTWSAPLEYQKVETSAEWVKRTQKLAVGAPGDPHPERAYMKALTNPPPIYETRSQIADGDSIVIAGRVRDGVLDAGELVMFGAPKAARATFRRLVLVWFAKAFAIVVIAGVCAFAAFGSDLAIRGSVPDTGPVERP